MNKQEIMDFFESFRGAELCYPFDEITAVYKVNKKMFGLISDCGDKIRVNLKGDPYDNVHLRSLFDFIEAGYHMNKTHWNSLYIDGTEEEELIKRLISESYNLVKK